MKKFYGIIKEKKEDYKMERNKMSNNDKRILVVREEGKCGEIENFAAYLEALKLASERLKYERPFKFYFYLLSQSRNKTVLFDSGDFRNGYEVVIEDMEDIIDCLQQNGYLYQIKENCYGFLETPREQL